MKGGCEESGEDRPENTSGDGPAKRRSSADVQLGRNSYAPHTSHSVGSRGFTTSFVPRYCSVRRSGTYLEAVRRTGSSCYTKRAAGCVFASTKCHKNTKLPRAICGSQAQNAPKLVFDRSFARAPLVEFATLPHASCRLVGEGINMRVDLSPRLGGHTVANQHPPLLSSSHSPSSSPERCKVSQQVWNRVMN